MKRIPLDSVLYKQVKKEADEKFNHKTSAYKSMWLVKQYKKRGGIYSGEKNPDEGLIRWLKEEWIDIKTIKRNKNGDIIDYKKCGRSSKDKRSSYPLCRPLKRITKRTPKTIREITKTALDKAKANKRSSKKIKFKL